MTAIAYVRHVKIHLLAEFTCSVCGKRRIGDGFSVEMESLPTQVQMDRSVRANHMPVGWGHYGNGDYRCEEHPR